MRPETRAKVDAAIEETGSTASELSNVQSITRREIERIAKRYSGERSSFLAAVAGGIAGGFGGIALHGALIVVTGPAGAALGAALAVLLWRGKSHWKLERATERARIAEDHQLSAIKALPKGAPQAVKDAMWVNYMEINSRYASLAADTVSEPDDGRLAIPALSGPPQSALTGAHGQLQPARPDLPNLVRPADGES